MGMLPHISHLKKKKMRTKSAWSAIPSVRLSVLQNNISHAHGSIGQNSTNFQSQLSGLV